MSARSRRTSAVNPDSNGTKKDKCGCNCLGRVSNAITNGLETCFYYIGREVARRPWVVMLCCVLAAGVMAPGVALFFYEEEAIEKLFVPDNSQAIEDKAFVLPYFPIVNRFELMIVEAENVLTPEAIQAMLDIDIAVKDIETSGVYNWISLCARVGSRCLSNSILELWSFDETIIRGLTADDIIFTINNATISPYYLYPYDVEAVLGDIEKDAAGEIVGAKFASLSWFLQENTSDTSDQSLANLLEWEQEYLSRAADGQAKLSDVYYYSLRSFDDLYGSTISSDLVFLFSGYILVSVFVIVVLGRFSHVHHRTWITLGGVVSVGLALLVSIGFCSYIGQIYTTVHSVLPFLFVGIGIDDAFVICHSLDALGPLSSEVSLSDKALHERMGRTLKHAGVSITVTSLTDILAFSVGASTTLPALRSFCIYAAVGIFAMYVFQSTFLVACLTYDEARVSQFRNACCYCHVHQNYKPNTCTEKSTVQKVFDTGYAPLLVKLPTKIVVLIITFAMAGVGIWGAINLKQDFSFTWFFPSDSYASSYWNIRDTNFPENGVSANIYFDSTVDYYNDYTDLKQLHIDLMNNEYIAGSTVDSWYYSFRSWTSTSVNPVVTSLVDSDGNPTNETNYYYLLDVFLDSVGGRFEPHVKFDSTDPNHVEISRTSFRYRNLEDAAEEVKAMDSTRELVRQSVPDYESNQIFAYSENYLDFETNKAIQQELYRNLGLAFLCVLLMTLVLLANLLTCLYVCLCVILTLVDVGACMYFWGLTIDTVTSINLIVAIGLAVDYSAHIAHTFMTKHGTRDARVVDTLKLIGPAVFYGGFSTFLAFVLLSASNSYVFGVFFKVFFLVVLFGLFHGMVFLPVLLSWIGPPAYRVAPSSADNISHCTTDYSISDDDASTKDVTFKKTATDPYRQPEVVDTSKLDRPAKGKDQTQRLP